MKQSTIITVCADHKKALISSITNNSIKHEPRKDISKNLYQSGYISADFLKSIIKRATKENYSSNVHYDKEGKPIRVVHIFSRLSYKNADDWYLKFEYINDGIRLISVHSDVYFSYLLRVRKNDDLFATPLLVVGTLIKSERCHVFVNDFDVYKSGWLSVTEDDFVKMLEYFEQSLSRPIGH